MPRDIITFGCRLNAYESEVIKKNLEASNVENVAVFNTCAVTKEAERQARQSIRRYRRENPDAKIIVTGCAAQVSPKTYADMKEVDQVLGNEEKLKQESYAPTDFIGETERVKVNDIMAIKETALHLVGGLEGRARAFLQVQNGCNHRCTFCIIPYGRGNSRSVPIGEIVQQAKALVAEGYHEIVVTGVDITDYGKDLPGTPTLGQMMRRVLAQVPELKRLRLSSIDVAEIDEDVLALIENEPRLMPHLHLSLQAGDNMILKRMARRHTREQVLEFCAKARKLRPDVVFGADIITGFPTETDEMFENTLKLVEEANIIYLHVFPYSEREGTPAAKIPANKQVPVPVRKARAKQLRELGETLLAKYLATQVGETVDAIIEKSDTARTAHYANVTLTEPAKKEDIGMIMPVMVKDFANGALFGALATR